MQNGFLAKLANIITKFHKNPSTPYCLLEHPHQLMQKFCKFIHLKPTFSILHSHFYKTPISVCLLHIYSNKIFNPHPPSTHPATIINPPNHHLQLTNLQLIHSYQTNKQSTKKKKEHTHNSKQNYEQPNKNPSVLVLLCSSKIPSSLYRLHLFHV